MVWKHQTGTSAELRRMWSSLMTTKGIPEKARDRNGLPGRLGRTGQNPHCDSSGPAAGQALCPVQLKRKVRGTGFTEMGRFSDRDVTGEGSSRPPCAHAMWILKLELQCSLRKPLPVPSTHAGLSIARCTQEVLFWAPRPEEWTSEATTSDFT